MGTENRRLAITLVAVLGLVIIAAGGMTVTNLTVTNVTNVLDLEFANHSSSHKVNLPDGSQVNGVDISTEPDATDDLVTVLTVENIVGPPVGTGDYTTISAALADIGVGLPAATATNPYLIKVGPGIYTEQVVMMPYVDLEGSGEGVTTIRWCGGPVGPPAATLTLADNSEVRLLTVRSEPLAAPAFCAGGIQPFMTAIHAIAGAPITPRLTHVSAYAIDGEQETTAIYNDFNADTIMTSVHAEAYNTAVPGGPNPHYARGVLNENVAAVMKDMTIIVHDNDENDFGVENRAGARSVITEMQDMTITVYSGLGTATNNIGIYNWSAGAPVVRVYMTHISIDAFLGENAYGVFNLVADAYMKDLYVVALDATAEIHGIHNDGSDPVEMFDVTTIATTIANPGGGVGLPLPGGNPYGGCRAVYNDATSPTMTNVVGTASCILPVNYGVENAGGSVPTMHNNVITSAPGPVGLYAILNFNPAGGDTAIIGASQLTIDPVTLFASDDGPGVPAPPVAGTSACVYHYDVAFPGVPFPPGPC